MGTAAEGDLISGRFRILRRLGGGAGTVTYQAEDTKDGSTVIVKLLSLAEASSWKSVDLFQREAGALKAIKVHGVPAYRDFFTDEAEGLVRFVLVREYVEGESIQRRVEQGFRADEAEISRIGAELLRITSALHALRPPVIHRDINPANVILQADGGVFLVDFGGVQDALLASVSDGGTMVGTAGYAPLEQFMGRATVRSDLFAVASTLVFLLSHRNPADLPARNMKTDLSEILSSLSSGLARVLDNYLEPDEERRTLPEEEAIALLEGRIVPTASPPEGRSAAAAQPAVEKTPPYGSRIRIREEPGLFSLIVPERGRSWTAPLTVGGFSVIWLGFTAFWTVSAIGMGAPVFFPIFSLPFWGVGLFLAFRTLFGLFGRIRIEVEPGTVAITRELFFFKRRTRFPSEGVEVSVRDIAGRQGTSSYCTFEAGARTYRFGVNLSEKERLWLASAVNGALASARPRSGRKGKE